MSEEDIRPYGGSQSITVLCVGPRTEAIAEYMQQERHAFSTLFETTLPEAISHLDTKGHIDCVLSNYHLPDQNGITLLRRVRDKYRHKPFVLLAHDGSEAVATDAINADADGYFQDTDGETEQYRRVCDRVETVVKEYRLRQTQRETRKRLLRLAESSDSAVWLFTADWSELLYVNSTYEDIWGRPRATLEEDPTDFLKGIHPEDRDKVKEGMGTLSEGESVELEYRVNPEEDYQRWVKVQGEPVFDDSGDIAYVAGFARDITRRKQRQKQLERQNQEMEVFNSLLRHDVLNGITVIRTRADELADDVEGEHRQYAETIVEWSDNITGLVQRIRDVLNTLTGGEPELEQVNLSEQLRHQVDVVETSHPAVEVETDVTATTFVQANELLTDVFKNLLTNAIEHNGSDGLRMRTTVEVTDETARVRIADNGRGIPDELKDEIFRRGRTGHVKQTGSGFGLFFVDAMVTAYGGEIHVEDNEMGGATFLIELPVERP